MDKYRNNIYGKNNSNYNRRFVKMVPVTQIETDQKVSEAKFPVNKEKPKKNKRSALEISDDIGVYGAFGRTLSELHRQGK